MVKKAIFFFTILNCASPAFADESTCSQTYQVQAKPDRQIERGDPNYLIDAVGNFAGIPQKLILLNPNIDSHIVKARTEWYIKRFIYDYPEEMKDVKIRINQCSPIEELDRLAKNKHISLIWRIFPGIPVTIWASLTGRILGGDNYNPYTNTVSIYSDDPAVAMHEMCHAKDFMGRSKGLDVDFYALGRVFSPVALYQEYTASEMAIAYFQEKGDGEQEKHSYSVLYPAFGTYGGSYSGLQYGNIIGAGIGHIVGLFKAHEYKLISQSVIYGNVCRGFQNDPASQMLINDRNTNQILLEKSLGANAVIDNSVRKGEWVYD